MEVVISGYNILHVNAVYVYCTTEREYKCISDKNFYSIA